MPRTGFEPARLAALPPQSSASANSATWARSQSGRDYTQPAESVHVREKRPRRNMIAVSRPDNRQSPADRLLRAVLYSTSPPARKAVGGVPNYVVQKADEEAGHQGGGR